jgi:hypothetical protein
MKMNFSVKFSLPVILAMTVALLSGCTTPTTVDWDSRVGHYTYNQALAEFGPPDRQARLSDGKASYKWYVQPPAGARFNSGMSYYGSNGFGAGQTTGTGFNSQMLQLTFDSGGTLVAWSKNNY